MLFLKPDGEFLVGEAAERRGAAEPDRLTREFKRRLGDQVPILVAGSPQPPQALLARLLSWVVEQVTQCQGAAPEHITLTYPANWGPYKRDLFDQTIALANVTGAATCTEPEAAATLYAARNVMAEGDCVAIYDLGGGTFDAAILRRTTTGFDLLGRPEGIEHLGGIDFDEAVFHHVLDSLGDAVNDLPDSTGLENGLIRLRRDCVEAKEALSADTDTVVPCPNLPGAHTTRPPRPRPSSKQPDRDPPSPTPSGPCGASVIRSADIQPGRPHRHRPHRRLLTHILVSQPDPARGLRPPTPRPRHPPQTRRRPRRQPSTASTPPACHPRAPNPSSQHQHHPTVSPNRTPN